jgi:hypothetical protein
MTGRSLVSVTVSMAERVVEWRRAQGLEVTRARAYRKNDQAWVEQKNGAIVRRLVGYSRFEGLESLRALCRQPLISFPYGPVGSSKANCGPIDRNKP